MAVVLSWERRAACPSILGPRTDLLYQDLACDSMNGQVAAAVGNEIVKHGRVYSNIDSGEATTVVSEDKVMERVRISAQHRNGGRGIKDNGGESTCNRWCRSRLALLVEKKKKTAASGFAGQESESGRLRNGRQT